MRNKRGSVTGSTLLDLLIVAILLVIAFFFVRDYILKPGGQLYKYNVEGKCLDFYRENNILGTGDISPKTCANNEQNNGCPETKKYCCDLYPDDDLKEGEDKYIGCCIPEEAKEKCPKPKAQQRRSLTGDTNAPAATS